jgi:hypothetical protein
MLCMASSICRLARRDGDKLCRSEFAGRSLQTRIIKLAKLHGVGVGTVQRIKAALTA